MDNLLLYIISIIHMLVIFFAVAVPFFGNNYLLASHAILMPFIMLHWYMNDDTCVLTILELQLREKITGRPCNKNDCFSCKVISPIYDITTQYNEYSTSIYLITITLWLVSCVKLYCKYQNGEIKGIFDLIVPKSPYFDFCLVK